MEKRDIKWFRDGDEKYSAERTAKIWNSKFANAEAFTSTAKNLYKVGSVLDNRMYAHRFAWLYMTGEWPERIDHINGVRHDNRFINLRSVSHAVNCRNTRKRTNKSGSVGIYLSPSGKFFAQITFDGVTICLGTFETITLAKQARKLAEEKYGFHKNHGREM